jgi:membrane associated rhomboid family serine protease
MDTAELSYYPITILLIAANVIISILALNNSTVMGNAIMWPYGVKRHHQYYRFISSGFIHADYMHLIFNMFTFFFFGRNLEIIFKTEQLGGGVSFVTLYFLALIISDIPTYIKQKDNRDYLCLGASGAVSAVVFATVVFSPWSSIYLYGAIKISALIYAVLYLAYCVYMSSKANDHINHDAHLWGSLFGLVLTLILIAVLQPNLFGLIIEQLKHPSLFGNG